MGVKASRRVKRRVKKGEGAVERERERQRERKVSVWVDDPGLVSAEKQKVIRRHGEWWGWIGSWMVGAEFSPWRGGDADERRGE